ncbi:hypothetical protein [Altererythrobacter aquiaggeris]|uniref:hypothetical protein n=1 Tax=Aestuarierythrobacter aquiaggeris TaxID=1898396 RepID=UPI003018D731
MSEPASPQNDVQPIERVLHDALDQGDMVLKTAGPILGHLLANDDHSLFSDEIIARIRGMTGDCARQFVMAIASAQSIAEPYELLDELVPSLTNALIEEPAFVHHCHALVLEWHFAARLQSRGVVDAVLSPLLQTLIASNDVDMAADGMALLAAQARFMQQIRRMELPLTELSQAHFNLALLTLDSHAGDAAPETVNRATSNLREEFGEDASRTGIARRLVRNMAKNAADTFVISQAGPALYLSGLSAATDQPRDLIAMATNDRQLARLALTLRAAGLSPKAVTEQFAQLHPEISLPADFGLLRADRAAAMLARSGLRHSD